MIQEIITYKNILNSLEDLINKSALKKSYIIEASGIPSPTFYRKLKSLSFTADETLKIVRILNPEESYLHELNESINGGKDDYNNHKYAVRIMVFDNYSRKSAKLTHRF